MQSAFLLPMLFLLLVARPAAHAQDVIYFGEIAATVRALDGSNIPGVTVTLLGEDMRTVLRTQITPKNGRVRFADLASGQYFVRCEIVGFFGTTIGPIQIRHGANAPGLPALDIRLNPGPVYWVKPAPAA